MYERRNLKSDLCLVFCCGVSLAMVCGIVFWMDDTPSGLDSDRAYGIAAHSVSDICAQSGTADCDFRLIDATAPSAGAGEGWRFDYYSPQSGPLSVQVGNTGGVSMVGGYEGQRY